MGEGSPLESVRAEHQICIIFFYGLCLVVAKLEPHKGSPSGGGGGGASSSGEGVLFEGSLAGIYWVAFNPRHISISVNFLILCKHMRKQSNFTAHRFPHHPHTHIHWVTHTYAWGWSRNPAVVAWCVICVQRWLCHTAYECLFWSWRLQVSFYPKHFYRRWGISL